MLWQSLQKKTSKFNVKKGKYERDETQIGGYLEKPLFNLDIRPLYCPVTAKSIELHIALYIAVAPHGLQMEIKTVRSDQRH